MKWATETAGHSPSPLCCQLALTRWGNSKQPRETLRSSLTLVANSLSHHQPNLAGCLQSELCQPLPSLLYGESKDQTQRDSSWNSPAELHIISAKKKYPRRPEFSVCPPILSWIFPITQSGKVAATGRTGDNSWKRSDLPPVPKYSGIQTASPGFILLFKVHHASLKTLILL